MMRHDEYGKTQVLLIVYFAENSKTSAGYILPFRTRSEPHPLFSRCKAEFVTLQRSWKTKICRAPETKLYCYTLKANWQIVTIHYAQETSNIASPKFSKGINIFDLSEQ